MPAATNRRKLSTTVSVETYGFLRALVEVGKAETLAEAVDVAVQPARRAENRARLERDTTAYFEGLPARVAAQEAELGAALGQVADEIDFDT
jgi:hypothetical protein